MAWLVGRNAWTRTGTQDTHAHTHLYTHAQTSSHMVLKSQINYWNTAPNSKCTYLFYLLAHLDLAFTKWLDFSSDRGGNHWSFGILSVWVRTVCLSQDVPVEKQNLTEYIWRSDWSIQRSSNPAAPQAAGQDNETLRGEAPNGRVL